MAERNLGRPWTAREDHLLTQAVALYGENDNWKTIALSVPNRTNKACRKRWLHSLSPSIKKTAWTLDEDRLLLDLYAAHGPKWSVIARQIQGRTDDACSKRYREALDPSLKKDEWTMEEDERLLEAYGRLGGRWGQVGQELNRSGLGCRNRWRMLERKRAAMLSRESSSNGLSSPFTANLMESSQEVDRYPITGWPPFMIGQPMGWCSQLLEGAHDEMLPRHPTSPALPQDFSPESTLQDISPLTHDIPLAEPHAFPPFQYSSSSLSAALSPSPRSRHVDTASGQTNSPDFSHNARPFHSRLHSSESCSPPNTLPDDTGPGFTNLYNSQGNHEVLPNRRHSAHNVFDRNVDEDIPLDSPSTNCQDQRHSPSAGGPSDFSMRNRGDVSSVSSTPLCLDTLTLSPIPSPTSASMPIDLPMTESPPSTSTLLSTVDTGHQLPQKPLKRPEQQGQLRLSSNLLLTSDPSVLPYTCGFEKCHTSTNGVSGACFATSKELSEHCRAEHVDRSCDDRPYRCGLDGCGKSWKSVNGLQYHLQISRAHFQHAISSTLSGKSPEGSKQPPASDGEGTGKPKKLYTCSQPQCSKVYRQLSGLRYHLLHGHPRDMPAQLQVVPPTLARKVADKLQAKDTKTG